MDINSLRYPSWCLARLLDNLIGTKKMVALRRKNDKIDDYVRDVDQHYERFFSGSLGEGFEFITSDTDLMYINNDTQVLESIQHRHTVSDTESVLLMEREGCYPGFVILRLLRQCAADSNIKESIVEYRGHPVVSSILHRDQNVQKEFGDVAHGPCNTFHDRGDVDIAFCFKCEKWPTEAIEFVTRTRLYSWPEQTLLEKIICRGCHLVPVGNKDDDLLPIQWRISFSAAEKDLVHSFNHTQFLVYGLLKIFLKQFLEKSVGDILCSYFMKTLMFYTVESTPMSLWRDDLLILCFWICLNKLIHWVEQGNCPNFFVNENNMFRVKVSGENQQNLLSVLKQCKRVGWTCLYLCEDLHSLQSIINHSETLNRGEVLSNEERQECSLDSIIIINALMPLRYFCFKMMLKCLKRSMTLLCYSRTKQEEDISMLRLHCAQQCFVPYLVPANVFMTNKDRYKIMQYPHKMLLMSIASNISSGYLSLATYYHMMGQYEKVIQICKLVIVKFKLCVFYHSIPHRRTYIYRRHWYFSGHGMHLPLTEKARLAYATDFVILSEFKNHYPKELRHDIEDAYPYPVYVPPLPYAVFLLFLCHHKLGNVDSSLSALRDLQVFIHDKEQGCVEYPIIINLEAICLEKLGDISAAMALYKISQALKPDRNGASRLIDNLLFSFFNCT